MTNQKKHLIRRPVTSFVLLALLPLACSTEDETDPPTESIEIRTTEYGIPHVRADNYRDLGYGQGYAQARDNLCKIELGMLGFRGELSRHFGAEGPPSSMNMTSPNSEVSDFYFRGIVTSRAVEDLVQQPAPLGPREEVRELVRGFVDGFNRRLSEQPDVECADEDWVTPMTEMDVYRRVFAVTTFWGQTAIHAPGIVSAEPPMTSEHARLESGTYEERLALASEILRPDSTPGSNAVALGGDITKSGGGINLANPHLAWAMDMHWHVGQLTIPGEMDVAGASLIGVPLVVMDTRTRPAGASRPRSRRFTT